VNVPIDQIAELQRLESAEAMRGPSRRLRRIQQRVRLVWIAFFGLATAGLSYTSVAGPGSIRLEMGLLTILSLLMLLFLVREEKGNREAKRREGYLWRRLQDLSQIFEVSLGVRSEQDVRQLAGLGLREAMLLLRADLGAITLGDPSGEEFSTVLGFEDSSYDHRPWLFEVRSMLRGLTAGTPIFVHDVETDSHFKKAAMLAKAGIRSFGAIRVGEENELTCFLVVGNSEPGEFRPGDAKTFEMIARQMRALLRHGRKLDESAEAIEDLKREVDELTYANQAKSEFASVASHELKTPLTAVKGSVDTLLAMARSGDFAAMEEFLLVIREEADRLIEMTGKILEISSLDYSNRVMERRSVRLRRVVDSCAQAMEVHLQEKDMHLEVDVDLDLPMVFADPGMVRQILINLIGNAVKFSSSGQTVTVSARRRGQSIEMVVRDQGSGIPLDEQPHIFDRFYQGSREGDNHIQSTGLGLAIVKEIVEQHQGQIRVESSPSAGASFIFELPMARDGGAIEGSALDVQPRGEVEEFLRLAVAWIDHVARSESTHLFLSRGEEIGHFHSSGEDSDCALPAELASQSVALDTSVLTEAAVGDGDGILAVPLKFRGEVAGAFVSRCGDHPFHQEDLILVEGIVERIGQVLGDAMARQQDPGRALRRAMHAVRDLLQSGQRNGSPRVDPGLLAWELAERAGADRELARDVRLATNFHDVTMAQIGMEIEKQDRPLSSDEQDKLRQHPRQASQLLEEIQGMEQVSGIVLHHHEWVNGEGYPDGLAGAEIPLGARIVAIIDAYCSMTAPRKYKPVRESAEAARELVNCAGRQFDRELIAHFLGMLRSKGWIEADLAAALLSENDEAGSKLPRPELVASVETIPADNNSEDGSL
jgi:signal transduction histidine kinase